MATVEIPDPPALPSEPDEEAVLRSLYGPPDENGIYGAPAADEERS
ncbi:hypothetical protein [Streptomyces halstedii]